MHSIKFVPFSINAFQNYFLKNLVACCIVILIASTSCSKKQFPVSSVNNKTGTFNNEMRTFLKAGAELKVNTHNRNPKQIIRSAEKYLGTPHCMGGTTKKCLDCSGLTYLSFAANKIFLPRKSQEQARYGRMIFNKNELQKGDLVFFTNSYNSPDYITHVGIYLGNGSFIHTSTSRGVVVTAIRNPWWSERFVFATRIF